MTNLNGPFLPFTIHKPYSPEVDSTGMKVVPELSILPNSPDGWKWQSHQPPLVSRIVNSPKKIVMLQAEPGTGKTLVAWAASQMNNDRALVLVHTRQLERQYTRDFGDMVLMEGRSHFYCRLTHRNADSAPCSIGVQCEFKRGGCDYYDRKRQARMSKLSIHNYAYWLGETRYNPLTSFRGVGMIVCDEAHDIQSVLMDSEVISFKKDSYKTAWPPPTDPDALKAWALTTLTTADSYLKSLLERAHQLNVPMAADSEDGLSIPDEGEFAYDEANITVDDLSLIRDIAAAKRVVDDLKTVISIPTIQFTGTPTLDDRGKTIYEGREWVIDNTEKDEVLVRPLYGKRGFARIVESAGKVVLMSAYLAPNLLIKTLGLDPDDVDVIEAGKIFDRTTSPVLYCPTVKMSYRTKEYEWQRVVKVIDELIDHFAPKSGMIHVPSVNLRNTVYQNSCHRDKFIIYEGSGSRNWSDDAMTKDEALEQFQFGSGQRVLLGQSISTGVDIPYVPEFNIVVKLSFPPTTDPALKARMESDKDYYSFLTICELVQAVGRGKRAPDHNSTTIILDAQFSWFHSAYREHFPPWFEDNLRWNGWKELPEVKRNLRNKGVIVN